MRIIDTDIQREKGALNRFFSACIGAGRAGEVMRHIPMKQLQQMQKECPFRYIRFHGILHEEMNVVHRDENGRLSFCFQYVDMLLDALLENNIRPVIELGLMPDLMAKEPAYVFWWKMNKSMPKEISQWSDLIEAFVRHVTYRYGESEIKKWYFEIWNEPNHKGFFTEYQNINAYFELYDAAAFAIKKVNEKYKVGGPATAGMQWIPEMIAHCRENNVPLDFITSHSYGIKGDFDPEGNAIVYIPNVDKVSTEIRVHGEYCKKEGYPLLITEWSSSFSPTDKIHDHYYNAPYVLRAIKRSEGFADLFSYWVYTDIFEESGPPTQCFHGGFGLFNMNSIPKPTYYAYTFLHRLGDTELIGNDEDSYVCKSEDGIQILFWNVKKPETKEGNRKYFSRPLPAEKLEDALVTIRGLKSNQTYLATVETIGYQSGDAYNAYLEGNFQELPTREEVAALIEKSKPKKKTFSVTANEKGILSFTVPQMENSADLIEIR